MNNSHILSAAISSFLLLVRPGSNANAAGNKMNMEKCFGIAKAGKNDCSSNKSAHSCAGQATKRHLQQDRKRQPDG